MLQVSPYFYRDFWLTQALEHNAQIKYRATLKRKTSSNDWLNIQNKTIYLTSNNLLYFIQFKQLIVNIDPIFLLQVLYFFERLLAGKTNVFFRRDKLWIAMEFCGGGSLQDIYHGNLLVRLCCLYGENGTRC